MMTDVAKFLGWCFFINTVLGWMQQKLRNETKTSWDHMYLVGWLGEMGMKCSLKSYVHVFLQPLKVGRIRSRTRFQMPSNLTPKCEFKWPFQVVLVAVCFWQFRAGRKGKTWPATAHSLAAPRAGLEVSERLEGLKGASCRFGPVLYYIVLYCLLLYYIV